MGNDTWTRFHFLLGRTQIQRQHYPWTETVGAIATVEPILLCPTACHFFGNLFCVDFTKKL